MRGWRDWHDKRENQDTSGKSRVSSRSRAPRKPAGVMAPLLLAQLAGNLKRRDHAIMSRAQWWAVGAVALGIAVVVYLVFFCPTECH